MIYLLSVFFIVFLQGCISPNLSVNKPTTKQEKVYPQTIHVSKKIQKNRIFLNIKTTKVSKNPKKIINSNSITGSIKGIIEKLSFDKTKHSWLYEVKGTDMSHKKLSYARFYHHKKLANKGDLVYIILNNSNLQNLFFIRKSNKIKKLPISNKKIKKIHYKKPTQKQNKHRKTSSFGLPIVEHVDF